jgi:predicted amino acid-binding ACT domain protein
MDKTFLIISVEVEDHRILFNDRKFQDQYKIPYIKEEQLCSFLSSIISSICHQLGVRVMKSECFHQDNKVALIMRADATDSGTDLCTLRQMLISAGEKVHAVVRVQKEDLFRYMHRI